MTDALPWVAAAHAACALLMTGLILFVQVVHYPLMRLVPADAWPEYERRHQQRTTIVVGPIMLAELALAIALLMSDLPEPARAMTLAAGALLVLIWASTFLIQVPLHRRLERAQDDQVIRRLVATNWIRTAAWSARAVLAVLIARSLSAA